MAFHCVMNPCRDVRSKVEALGEETRVSLLPVGTLCIVARDSQMRVRSESVAD